MADGGSSDRVPFIVPGQGEAEWLELARALDDAGPVPCQDGRAEDWWPDAKGADKPPAARALGGCRRCPVADPCLSYAVAADERFGVWGGTLPQERRAIRWRST